MIYKNLILLIALTVLLGGIMLSTNPDDFSAPLLVVVFALLYVLTASSIALVLQVFQKLKIIHITFAKITKISAIGSILPIFMLLLHSIGQLTSRDIFLAVMFFGLLYFYYTRMGKKART